MGEKVVIYARYSSDKQREESIEGQLRECYAYAKQHDMCVIKEYTDRAFSAKTDARPSFQQLIADSAQGHFDTVLVWKLDRFARNRFDSAHYRHILQKNGVKLISATEAISDGPDGILLESLLEGMAEYYSAELAQKIRRGQHDNAKKCRWNGGALALGYQIDTDGHYQIDPVTAPIVQEIFTRYADGESAALITNSLNARGLTSARGCKFNKNSLHSLLRNRRYIGEYHYGDVMIPNGVPAIIEPVLFNRAQKRLEKNKRAPAHTKAKEEYLLTGKLFCGLCGKAMAGESGKSHTGVIHYYYKCMGRKRGKHCYKKTVHKNWIEKLIVQQTVSLVMCNDVIARIADAVITALAQENTTLPKLNADLKDVDSRLKHLLSAIEQGLFTPATKERLGELEQRKSQLEDDIARESLRRTVLTREQIVFWLMQFRQGDVSDKGYQKRLIDCFVNALYLYDDKLVLIFNYKDGSETISFDLFQSSDLYKSSSPR